MGIETYINLKYGTFAPNLGKNYPHQIFMRQILSYRKLLGVDETAELKTLKSVYRNLMKEWHPDKFNDDHALKIDAEEKSKKIIDYLYYLFFI